VTIFSPLPRIFRHSALQIRFGARVRSVRNPWPANPLPHRRATDSEELISAENQQINSVTKNFPPDWNRWRCMKLRSLHSYQVEAVLGATGSASATLRGQL
jgi:hypothetical protein